MIDLLLKLTIAFLVWFFVGLTILGAGILLLSGEGMNVWLVGLWCLIFFYPGAPGFLILLDEI